MPNMAEYPCAVCAIECQEDSIFCSNCNNWVHAKCCNLSMNELPSWSSKNLTFVCIKCAFISDTEYDAASALDRLRNKLSNDKVLSHQAKSEEKLLRLYNVTIPKSLGNSSPIQCDHQSIRILQMFHPPMLSVYVPALIVGDGNCLFRSVSYAISGSQNHHSLLRLFCALELIQNRSYYDTKRPNNDFLNDSRIVISDYTKLLSDAVHLGSYSEVAHIYALSAALTVPINSYYPPQIHSEYTSEALTRRIIGRNVRESKSDIPFKLMWTCTSGPISSNTFSPNHFVPLLESNTINRSVIDLDSSSASYSSPDKFLSNNMTEDDRSQCHTSFYGENNECTDTSFIHENAIDEDNDSTKGTLKSSFLSAQESVNLLLKSEKALQYIPGGIKENVYYILDNSKNFDKRQKNKKSAFSDDCGVWDTSKGATPKYFFHLKDDGDLSNIFFRNGVYCISKQVQKKRVYIPMDPQPSPDKVVVIHRYYTTLKLSTNYKKRVTWLGEGGLRSSYALVEYLGTFPGLSSHANSHTASEYVRVPDYVMDEARDLSKKMKPLQVYETLQKKYDETTRPSNINQIRNLKKYDLKKDRQDNDMARKNVADQVSILETLVSANDSFVRSVIRTNAKTPTIILYTDEQLTDLRNMCCLGQSVLGVDKTFNLCDMHVTVTCFKQLAVNRPQTGKPPIFIGPLFIHDNSDCETYSHFFHHLKMKLVTTDTPTNRLVIGSDDEKALVKAIRTVFHDSTHVLCIRHLRQNTKQQLTDDAINIHTRNDILNKIFGPDGIVESYDEICFDDRCEGLEEQLTLVSKKFLNYFKDRLRPLLREKVNRPARHELVDDNWTNNNCESINHVLKQAVDWKSKTLTDLVNTLHSLVDRQYSDLKSALLGTGEYRLSDNLQEFKVTKTEWISMTDNQRQRHYKRFRGYKPVISGLMTSTDGQTSIVPPKTHGKKPGQRKRKVNAKTTTIKRQKTDLS